ncbi:unnamed protein product [Brassicogethes aeneus]|uniref:Fibronectin type-III domain-containing protein n=1 Tax=Brassicogethes aeneus TaxID=1431903 RepID=A0A9P0B3H8_BRAAE|nr:unnamed protein product [Brassicogethes aeneus]
MDKNEVFDTLQAAKVYLHRLKSLDNELESAEKQIDNTFDETEKIINDTFHNLKETITKILVKRQEHLLEQARKVKKGGRHPLEDCRSVVQEKIDCTEKLLKMGDLLLSGKVDGVNEFMKNSSLLGALPEVPELTEVPFISFQYEICNENELTKICSQIGEISRIAPIQISNLGERPGAILVEWQVVENEERCTDIQAFRLQRAFGDVVKEKHLIANFVECYKGLDTQFLVRELQANQLYSFRVCCMFEGSNDWSPWSLPQVSKTNLKSFSWKPSADYTLSNENKIAQTTSNAPEVLISEGPQFLVGHSVEFTLLEVDSSEALIGLLTNEAQTNVNDFKQITDGTFFIDRSGRIYVDRVEKSTMLPEFTKGLNVSFTCELVNNNKVRVNIDSSDKRVTYEWQISPDSKIYFAAQFYSDKWKIMVE